MEKKKKTNKKLIFGMLLSLCPSTSFSDEAQLIQTYCAEVKIAFKKLKWKTEPCRGIEWKFFSKSVQGHPLLYVVFGATDENAKNRTLILSTVHGDEITPTYLGFELAHYLNQNPLKDEETQVIIAPIVNPDSFLSQPKKRVNQNGVDVNRNFMTKDWEAEAIEKWKKKFKSDPRRNPGKKPASEPETIFQQELISRFKPDKILSIHAPLNFLDYDGPNYMSLNRFSTDYVRECLRLRQNLKASSQGFYPGSLGNYAGQDLGIPTVTLELATANPAKAHSYWQQFKKGIELMIDTRVKLPDAKN